MRNQEVIFKTLDELSKADASFLMATAMAIKTSMNQSDAECLLAKIDSEIVRQSKVFGTIDSTVDLAKNTLSLLRNAVLQMYLNQT